MFFLFYDCFSSLLLPNFVYFFVFFSLLLPNFWFLLLCCKILFIVVFFLFFLPNFLYYCFLPFHCRIGNVLEFSGLDQQKWQRRERLLESSSMPTDYLVVKSIANEGKVKTSEINKTKTETKENTLEVKEKREKYGKYRQ